MSKQEIMAKLAATDGRNGASWDDEVLSAAADSCIRGESPYQFAGRPAMQKEQERFAAAWQDCQND